MTMENFAKEKNLKLLYLICDQVAYSQQIRHVTSYDKDRSSIGDANFEPPMLINIIGKEEEGYRWNTERILINLRGPLRKVCKWYKLYRAFNNNFQKFANRIKVSSKTAQEIFYKLIYLCWKIVCVSPLFSELQRKLFHGSAKFI